VRAIILSIFLIPTACQGGSSDDDPIDATASVDSAVGADAPVSATPVVIMETTLGNLVVELYPEHMPNTVANFLGYVDTGWYDGTLVHRVIDDWVIQGGGFTTGLSAKTPGPAIALETSTAVSHVHGAISMARTSDPDSATTQWFICDWPDQGTAPQPAQLDGSYAAFGVLIEGFDVLAAITQVSTSSQGSHDDVPVTEVLLSSARRQ